MDRYTADHISSLAGATASRVKLPLILLLRITMYGDNTDCRTGGVRNNDGLCDGGTVCLGAHQRTAAAIVTTDPASLILRSCDC